jgi:glycosyltransferase involved in cell wall biosynthesis
MDVDKRKIIWCIRESEREVYFNKYKDIDYSLFKSVSSVVFVAESTCKIYADLADNNFVTVHNGLDLEKVDTFCRNNSKTELRKRSGFSKTDIIFNLTGTVCLRKGQLEFVQSAICVLDQTKNHNLKFILVGGRPSPYELCIRQIIRQSNYEKNILIIEETPEAYKYLFLSDYFVCNSYIESFPRVVLEAMAFRLPIIATNVYGISEQIENNKDGVLIMAGDTKDLSRKIKWFIDNSKEAEKFAIEARKKVERNFSFETMLDKYISLIKNICAE